MGGYIVLCDHNSKWAEKFTDEAINRNIQTVVVESIAEIEDKLTEDGSSIMLVCSLIELREYLKNNTVDEKIFFEKVSVFVISDSNDDNEEIYYIRQGCVDFQWRKRNIFIIVERIMSIFDTSATCSESGPIFIHLTAPFAATLSVENNVSVITIDMIYISHDKDIFLFFKDFIFLNKWDFEKR